MTRLPNKIIKNMFAKFEYSFTMALLHEYKNDASFLSNGSFSSPNFFKVNHREQKFQLSDSPVCYKARLILLD